MEIIGKVLSDLKAVALKSWRQAMQRTRNMMQHHLSLVATFFPCILLTHAMVK